MAHMIARLLNGKSRRYLIPIPHGMRKMAHWILIEDLMGGTYGMRKKHRRYLPQEPRELDESYDNRLARSVVAPYYQRLERMLAGMLTRKPVRLEDTSDVITEQLFDVDMQNNDLNVWVYETARKLVRYGHIGTLVDAPQDGGRPYWVTYTPRQILGWRTEPKDGQQVLSMLRLSETVTIPDGEYGEKTVQQIRLLTPGAISYTRKVMTVSSASPMKAPPALARSHSALHIPTASAT
jgi:hypothetical protein